MNINFAKLLRLELERTPDDRVRLSLHNPVGDGHSLLETVIDIEQLEQFVRVQGGSAHRDSLVELMRRRQWSSSKLEERSLIFDQPPNGTN
jgi:hypothetical protein